MIKHCALPEIKSWLRHWLQMLMKKAKYHCKADRPRPTERGGGLAGEGEGGVKGGDVEGPGKWSAPGPALAVSGPG